MVKFVDSYIAHPGIYSAMDEGLPPTPILAGYRGSVAHGTFIPPSESQSTVEIIRSVTGQTP